MDKAPAFIIKEQFYFQILVSGKTQKSKNNIPEAL